MASQQPANLSEVLAIIIPIKAFHQAKERLSDLLTPAERFVLAKLCAERVLQASVGYQVFVVCDDEEVAQWARAQNAKIVWQSESGLNNAIKAGVKAVRARNFELAMIVHSDLPLATGFSHLFNDRDLQTLKNSITVVPDRHEDGTNVMIVPTASDFEFAYGRNSFIEHQQNAKNCNLTLRIIHDQFLSVDIDTAQDLDLAQKLQNNNQHD
ncbi:MAG: 2-phospho-L-lactate guanylyltransferase [Actinomycetota bacterium]